jgi:ferredoxin
MAKITNTRGKSVELEDGESIRDACERLGVKFSCQNGLCGTCMTDVVEGKENLSEMTEQEKMFHLDEDLRLACQCKIKSGEVVIDP